VTLARIPVILKSPREAPCIPCSKAGVKEYCPQAFIISVANPLDAIVYRLYKQLGVPKNRILGMAGVLDSSRYRYFVAKAAGVSAFVSPAWSALEMLEAIAYDKKKILAVCTLLEGEYGVDGLFVGVPAILGRGGVEKIVQIKLTAAETAALQKSVAAVGKTCAEVDIFK